VIDTSGTMSGGGNRVVRGRMGSSCVSEDISPDEIDKLQKKNDKLTAELQTVRSVGEVSLFELKVGGDGFAARTSDVSGSQVPYFWFALFVVA